MEREKISSKYKWNLNDIYSSIEEYYKDIELVKELVNKFIKYKGKIVKNSANLLKALELNEKINIILSKTYVYANMSLHVNTKDSFYQELTGNLDIILSDINEKTAFFVPELLSIDYKTILKFIKENKKLERFEFFLEQIFNEKEHILSLKEEELLSRGSNLLNFSSNIFSNLNDSDIVFEDVVDENNKKHPLTKGTYQRLISSKDRTIRKNAFKNLYKKYKELNNTIANIMNLNLLTTNFKYKTRKYSSPLNMYLDKNKIDLSIYYNLIDSVNANLNKIYKYFELRKKVLKYDELHMYDLAVPLIEEENKEYTYEDAKDLVIKGLEVLGDSYVKDLKIAFENNWIDVYENEGKRGGAYAWGCYPNHPYVLLNYQNRLYDVSVVAHELGHAMHRYYSNLNQDFFYSDNEIFVAEIASTVNESLLKFYLLDHSNNKNEKLNIINEILDDIKNTIYRQTMFAEFELKIHDATSNNESLSSNKLNDMYYELVKKYHGDNVVVDEDIKYEWSRIPHFYTPFYVYQYATGLSIALAIATKIYNGDKNMLEKYLTFLKSGSNDYPTKLVEKMGIDISKSIDEALELFEKYINEFNNLL